MIDYEKLKMAKEIASDTENYFFKIKYGDVSYTPIVLYDAHDDNCALGFETIDGLIAKLQELTRPKLEIGQNVFIAHRGYIYKAIINSKSIDGTWQLRWAGDQYSNFEENDIFTNKKELIQYQIDHWICLQNEEKSTGNEDVSTASTNEKCDCIEDCEFIYTTPFECKCFDIGADHEFKRMIQEINYILDGKDDGSGINYEPWGELRKRLLDLVRKANDSGSVNRSAITVAPNGHDISMFCTHNWHILRTNHLKQCINCRKIDLLEPHEMIEPYTKKPLDGEKCMHEPDTFYYAYNPYPEVKFLKKEDVPGGLLNICHRCIKCGDFY